MKRGLKKEPNKQYSVQEMSRFLNEVSRLVSSNIYEGCLEEESEVFCRNTPEYQEEREMERRLDEKNDRNTSK